jgi:hypothetical protein
MILNLTQHTATADQINQGVADLPEDKRSVLQLLLTFDSLPSSWEISERANAIAALAQQFDMDRDQGPISAMIGGAPFLMSSLEGALEEVGVQPLYAFSVRESVEQQQPDGTVRKVNVFKHQGFVSV